MDKRRYMAVLMFFEVGVIVMLFISLVRSVIRRNAMPQPVFMARLGKEAYMGNPNSAIPGFYEPVPSRTEIQSSEWYHPEVRYIINRDTLHDRFNYDVKKPDGIFRIVTLGDSFTFGMYVNTMENYSERLENMLGVSPLCGSLYGDVINLGVPGYDLEFSKERYRLRGQKYDADMLILFIVYNDFTERSSMSYLQDPTIIKALVSEGYSKDALLKQAAIRMAETMHRLYGNEQAIGDFQERMLRELLDSIRDTPIILAMDSHVDPERQKNVIALAAAYPNAHILRLPLFSTLPDTHPTVLGHMEIAKEIYRYTQVHQDTFCRVRPRGGGALN